MNVFKNRLIVKGLNIVTTGDVLPMHEIKMMMEEADLDKDGQLSYKGK